MIASTSALGSTLSMSHAWSASSGMNSMKRTSYGFSRANAAKRSTSSSVKPRSATALTLIGRSSGIRLRGLEPGEHAVRASRAA